MTTAYLRPYEPSSKRLWRWTSEIARLVTLPLERAIPTRTGRMYDELIGVGNTLGENSLFLNLGYWASRPETLDEASAAMARLVATEADMSPGDVVIDVGPGFGDQDFLWINEFGPSRITGVNVSQRQIDMAAERAADLGLSDRIEYVLSSASNLPAGDASSDKVVALESVFHFPSRREFFCDAFRVLVPGGKLVATDIAPLHAMGELTKRDSRRAAAVAPGWLYLPDSDKRISVSEYPELLRQAGFVNVTVRSIRDDVFGPYADYMRERLRKPDARRINPLARVFLGPYSLRVWSKWLDYVIVSAEKPSS
jgi:ubiquinone/menaquinone biosynthesis C-methylase UbiE